MIAAQDPTIPRGGLGGDFSDRGGWDGGGGDAWTGAGDFGNP